VTVLEPAGTAVLVGNPKPRSRTWALAHAVVAHLLGSPVDSGASAVDGQVSIADRFVSTVDLGAIAADPLGRGGAWAAALAAVPAATLLVVATPTYRGAYTGLLKLFADDLPPRALAGTVAVGVQTAASPAHLPAGEAHLRPLLLELGARVPAPVLAVGEADLADPAAVIQAWALTAAPALAGALAGLSTQV
jgi:FMN reductase